MRVGVACPRRPRPTDGRSGCGSPVSLVSLFLCTLPRAALPCSCDHMQPGVCRRLGSTACPPPPSASYAIPTMVFRPLPLASTEREGLWGRLRWRGR